MGTIVGLLNIIWPMLLVFVIFYFLLIMPEKKRKQKYKGMLDELKVNDEIVTRGGIIGKITHIDEKTVTIETSSAKTRIKLEKNGISNKVKAE
jgi:preprotein translocase subunit YajC